jgi:hypothetical protein
MSTVMRDDRNDLPRPSTLGLQPSFGFGDRLGLATPGHILACKRGRLVPIFAQQSIREMTRTQRTPDEVMSAAQIALQAQDWNSAWGADADHLKTRDDVFLMANAGFTFFTIDPSEYVDNRADEYSQDVLETAVQDALQFGAWESDAQLQSLYLNTSFEVGDGLTLRFGRESLLRAVAKYGKAVQYAQQMAAWIAEANTERDYEIEISVDETYTPTTPLEHLSIGLELQRRGVKVVSLAPRFVGEFEKGIDYKGDVATFESTLEQHVAIARHCGPYKISVHSGSDKFAIYPSIGRICGDLLHVKTAGTSYLEALRVAARQSPQLFLEILTYSRERFDEDRVSYHISAELSRLKNPLQLEQHEREQQFLDGNDGRQMLHVTFGSVLTKGHTSKGQSFKDALLQTLHDNSDLHDQFLAEHLGRHIQLLSAG